MKRSPIARSVPLQRTKGPMPWPEIWYSRGRWYFHGDYRPVRWWRPTHLIVLWRHKQWERRYW